MAEHVEDDAAAILLAVVPRWPLRRLPVALEHPIAELAAHREDAPEEAGLDQHLELEQPGKKELVLHHAVLDASRFGRARHVERIRERLGDRLLAINVLAGRDRLAQELCAQLGGGGVEEQRVLAVLERGVEVAGPAREPVRADGENRADQMLVHAHAAGDAVHDDAEPVLRHFNFLSRTSVIPVRAYQVNWKSARAANSVLPSPLWGGSARSAGVGGRAVIR